MKSRWIALFSLFFLSLPLRADVPAVVGTTLTQIQTDALAIVDLIWPVVLTVMGAFILIKLVKRGGNKI